MKSLKPLKSRISKPQVLEISDFRFTQLASGSVGEQGSKRWALENARPGGGRLNKKRKWERGRAGEQKMGIGECPPGRGEVE